MKFSRRRDDSLHDLDARNDPLLLEYERARDLVNVDPHRAAAELDVLRRRGSIMSMLYIADAMRDGTLYDKDLDKAERWYRVGVQSGSHRALVGLAMTHFLMGRTGEAIAELKEAVEHGYPPAMNSLAGIYFRGDGIPSDRQAALSLWKRASSLGHIHAKRHLISQSARGRRGITGFLSIIPLYLSLLSAVLSTVFKNLDSDRLR